MPQTVGNYTYTVVDGDMTVPNLVSKPRKTFPIESDSSVYVLEEDYMQFIEYYEPLQPSAVHPDLPNVYFAKDSDIRDIGNGVGAWTRTWMLLPGYDENGKKTSYVNSSYESFVFTVPGITTAATLFILNPVASHTHSGGNLVLTTSPAHDIEVGKGVVVSYVVADPINNIQFPRQAFRMALAGTSGTTVVVKDIRDINEITPTEVHRASTNAEPYQKTVASRVDTDYWLPGVNINSMESISIVQQFEIIDQATGNRTEYLSETTTPTIDEYRQFIEDDKWLVAESSVIRRFKGSEILERSTRYVKYTL